MNGLYKINDFKWGTWERGEKKDVDYFFFDVKVEDFEN